MLQPEIYGVGSSLDRGAELGPVTGRAHYFGLAGRELRHFSFYLTALEGYAARQRVGDDAQPSSSETSSRRPRPRDRSTLTEDPCVSSGFYLSQLASALRR